MTCQTKKIVSLIILERFGPVVEKVASYLYGYGTAPLLHIKKTTELPLSKVKESLCILIKYRLVTFEPNKNENIANYTLQPDMILLMLRYPKYISLIKKKFGDESEMIVEEILQRGYWTASEVILKVVERMSKNEQTITLAQVKEKFTSLAVAKYIRRMPHGDVDKPVPTLVLKAEEVYQQPLLDLQMLSLIQSGLATTDQSPDSSIFWAIDFDRFHQDMRDKLVVDAITNKLDEHAGELVKLFLQQMYIRTEPWADVSNPIPVVEIKNIVRKQKSQTMLDIYFDQYITILKDYTNNIVKEASIAGGGSLELRLKDAFTLFVWETVEQTILEKHDAKAARIFRLVKLKPRIQMHEIQEQAMILAKEAKQLTYKLVEQNFLEVQELHKAPAIGQNKSFLYFYVNLEPVARELLEFCYKALFNTLTRKNHEREINKRIIDKKQRVDTIAMGMHAQGADEQQLVDIEEMITPPERQILEKIDKMMKKLNTVELETDDTLFLLQMYLRYQ